MDIMIGLPNTVAGVTRDSLLEWSQRARKRAFPGVASLDRLVYPGYEALISLAAAAAVTERVRLTTHPFYLQDFSAPERTRTSTRKSRTRTLWGV